MIYQLKSSCKNCKSNSIGLYIFAWALYLLIFIPTLFWSTQIFQNETLGSSDSLIVQVQKYQEISLLKHYEVHNSSESSSSPLRKWLSTILYSSVCPLGKVSFYILVFLMLLYLIVISMKCRIFTDSEGFPIKIITCTFAGIFGLIFLLFLFMNWPLFVRSIPAIVAVAGILTIGIIATN